MIRFYCDICSTRIEEPKTQVVIKSERLTLSITRALDGKWNSGQVCVGCIREAVAEGEPNE